MYVHSTVDLCARISSVSTARSTRSSAFSLVELLVVIGIIGALIAMLLPSLVSARKVAQRTECASNLRQLGLALQTYANAYQGWVPRDCTLGRADREPWMRLLAEQLETRREIADEDLKRKRVLQCPSHPVEDIPTAFTINAFAFETRPSWAPDGPIKLVQPRRHSELPWILESSDTMPGVDSGGTVPELIYGIQFHDAWEPAHLPRQSGQRISDNRHHGRTANVLYLDGHVGLIRQGELVLEMLDDGVRKRATAFPPTQLRPEQD